jgi:hypothetical protein
MVLSPAIKTKLATLEKGQLMVRHPHFTQPIFVKFPRPAVMLGRDGADRYPQAVEVSLEHAIVRSLRPLDAGITLGWVKDVIAIATEEEVIRARNATLHARPEDVKGFFAGQFRRIVPPRQPARTPTQPLKTTPGDDPYGF